MNPWEKYQKIQESTGRPWEKYKEPEDAPTPLEHEVQQKTDLEKSYDDVMGRSPTATIAGNLWNAGKNVVQTATALNEGANQAIEGIENPFLRKALSTVNRVVNPIGGNVPKGASEAIEEYVPEFQNRGTGQQIVGEGIQIAAGMAGPGKFIKTAEMVGLPRFFANVAKYNAVNAGGIAAVDDDVKPLFTGENAEFVNLLGPLAVDETGEYNEEYLKRRLNLLTEAAVLAKPAELGARSATAATKFLKTTFYNNLFDWGNKTAHNKQAVRDMIDQLGEHDVNATPEQDAQFIESLAGKIEKEANVKVSSEGLVGVDDLEYKRPTMDALYEASDSPVEKARAAGLRSSAVSKGAPQTEAAMAKPSLEIERISNQTREAFGGKEGVEKARKGVLESADEEFSNYTKENVRQEDNLFKEKMSADDLVKDDEYLGGVVQNAEKGTQFDLRTRVNDAADAVVEKHNTNKGAIIKESNRLFDQIPDSAPAQMDEFNSVRAEVEEFIPDHLKQILDNADGSYGYLKKTVYPKLSRYIDSQFADGGNRYVAYELMKLRDNITRDQLAHLTESGSEITAAAAIKADKNYKEVVAPLRQGTSEELTNLSHLKNKRSDEYAVKSRGALKSTLDDPDKAEYTRRVLDVVKDDKLKTDYVLGTFAEDISDEIASKGIDGVDTVRYIKNLRNHIPMLGPSGAARVQKLISNIEKKKGNIKGMEKELGALKTEMDEAKNVIYKGQLRKFFDEEGLQNLDADQVFTKYLEDADGANALKQVVNRARSRNDPAITDGIRAAYSKYFKSRAFRGGTDAAGGKNINENTLKNIEDNKDKLLEFGDMIYGKDHVVMKMYRQVLKDAGRSSDMKGAVKVPYSPINTKDKEARGAIDFAITQVFGALNRTGARLRSLTGRTVSKMTKQQHAINAIDFVNANPEAAAKLMREIAKDTREGLSKESKRRIHQFMVLNGLLDDDYEPDLDDQTEENFKVQKEDTEEKSFFDEWFDDDETVVTSQNIERDSSEPYTTSDYGREATEQGAFYGEPDDAYARGQSGDVLGLPDEPVSAEGQEFEAITSPRNAHPFKNMKKGVVYNKEEMTDNFQRAGLAKNRNAIAALGYDPRKITMDPIIKAGTSNLGGIYHPDNDRIWAIPGRDDDSASTLMHESMHRGLEMLRKRRPDIELPVSEEQFVRYMMERDMGDPEKNQDQAKEMKRKNSFMKNDLEEVLQELTKEAQLAIKERKPRGPR